MNNYFKGPNITYQLIGSYKGIFLEPKFSITRKTHNLGKILSIKHANQIITVYYTSNIDAWNIFNQSLLYLLFPC